MPPCVTRRMSDFAFGGSMGDLGATSGSGASPCADQEWASAARPAASTVRRDTGVDIAATPSVEVQKLVGVQDHMTEIGEGGGFRAAGGARRGLLPDRPLRCHECICSGQLVGRWPTAKSDVEHPLDPVM